MHKGKLLEEDGLEEEEKRKNAAAPLVRQISNLRLSACCLSLQIADDLRVSSILRLSWWLDRCLLSSVFGSESGEMYKPQMSLPQRLQRRLALTWKDRVAPHVAS